MAELGKAYVQIIPSAEGIKGRITEALGGESDSAGKLAGLKIAGAIKKAIIGLGIGALLKETFSEGAELQQSIGGIETLFGTQGAKSVEEYAALVKKDVSEIADEYAMLSEAQTIAMDNASRAYETAGLSANDYMQTVTGFAAALKSSTSNEVEAANVANMAVIDMADNANKMGTSMESIQNAYQGFAKQNYTMLDNLKLGYGGTKTEMERLLADATKLTGVEYDINNLSDVYEAIHVIQEDLGITGTTAAEAAQTFSGSMSAMKAAAQNVLGNLFLGEDIKPAMEALVSTVSTFLIGNLLPAVINIVGSLPDAVITLISAAIPELLSVIDQIIEGMREYITNDLPAILEGGSEIMSGLVEGFFEGMPGFLEKIGELISLVGEALMMAAPVFLESGLNFIAQLAQGILNNLPTAITAIGNIITGLIGYLMENMPAILQKGYEVVSSLAQGILNNMPAIVSSIAGVIAQLIATIGRNLPAILQKGIEIIANIASGIIRAIPRVVATIPQVISGIRNKFTSYNWLSIGSNIISGIANGIRNGVGKIISAAKDAAQSAFDAAKSFLGIASPSKLFYYLGDMTVEGYVSAVEDGRKPIDDMIGGVLGNAVSDFESGLTFPKMSAYEPATRDDETPEERAFSFSIPVVLDGREIARASATYTQDELNRLTRNSQRREGVAW